MSNMIEKFENIEKEFFELDDEKKIAHMKLEFASPDEIFDKNSITKTPVFNDDFNEWLTSVFEYTPKKYKVDLDVSFADLGGYTEEELNEIFIKNVTLEFKRSVKLHRSTNKVGMGLLIVGVLFTIAMILVESLWVEEAVGKIILLNIVEIASWVTIWEALDVFLIENSERRRNLRNLKKRFGEIKFHKK